MSFLKDAIEAADPAPSKEKELTLALNLLFELAEQKKNLQRSYLETQVRTAGTVENPSIPITNTLAWHSETRAYVSADATNLVKTVTDAVKKFVAGGSENIIGGIGDLLSGGLNAILGSGTGTESELHSYFVLVEGFSILRFDVTAWQRKIEVTGITQKIQNAMTFSAVKSSVNVDKISFNTFLSAYNSQLLKMQFSPEEIKKFIIEAKEIFELLKDPSNKQEQQLITATTDNNKTEPGYMQIAKNIPYPHVFPNY
jgi:hypothetical protein